MRACGYCCIAGNVGSIVDQIVEIRVWNTKERKRKEKNHKSKVLTTFMVLCFPEACYCKKQPKNNVTCFGNSINQIYACPL